MSFDGPVAKTSPTSLLSFVSHTVVVFIFHLSIPVKFLERLISEKLHILFVFFQLDCSQLMFDTHISLAEGVRGVCNLKSELCNASADLLYLLYPILVNKADTGLILR